MRDKILIKLADWAVNRTRWTMIAAVLVTVVLGALAGRIQITPKWSDMLPKGDKRTIEFDRILEEFTSASSIVVVVQGEEERIKTFADSLAPKLLEPLPVPGEESERKLYVRRVDYTQEVDFIKDHGLMLMKASDLKNLRDVFEDPNLVPLLTHPDPYVCAACFVSASEEDIDRNREQIVTQLWSCRLKTLQLLPG